MTHFTRSLSAVVVALIVAPAAHAVTLYTPYVVPGGDQFMRVEVLNPSTKDVVVTVTCQNRSGSVNAPTANICSESPTLAPGVACSVFYPTGVHGFCKVEASSSKVRAALSVQGPTNGLAVVVPATK